MTEQNKEKFVDLKEQRQTKELTISKREIKRLTPTFAITALLGFLLAGICWINDGNMGSESFMITTDQCAYLAMGITAIAIFYFTFPKVRGKVYNHMRSRSTRK